MQQTSAGPIHELLQPETIQIDLPGSSKQEVIDNLLDLLEGHPAIEDMDEVRRAVWDRENVMSTGVGKELGLPHAKTGAVDRSVAALGITREPVEFGAIDDRPVRLLFLLVGPEGAKSQHIRILSRISRLMNREAFREQLLDANSPEEVLSLFKENSQEA